MACVCQWPRSLGFKLSHTKHSKMELEASLLNTPYYKIRIKSEWSKLEKGLVSHTHTHLDVVANEKEVLGLHLTKAGQLTTILLQRCLWH